MDGHTALSGALVAFMLLILFIGRRLRRDNQENWRDLSAEYWRDHHGRFGKM